MEKILKGKKDFKTKQKLMLLLLEKKKNILVFELFAEIHLNAIIQSILRKALKSKTENRRFCNGFVIFFRKHF